MFTRSAIRTVAAALIAVSASACRNEKREALRELGKRGVEASGASLLAAVQEGDAALARLLLEAEVYSGQRDADGNSPLHLAIGHGHAAIAWDLIEKGADLATPTPAGVTPVSLSVAKGETAMTDRLLDAGAPPVGLTPDGDKVLPWAIRNGRLAFVRRLMEGGADPHQKDAAGNPLLHVAIEAGRRDLMKELLDLGADAAAVNAANESSLVAALRKDWRDLAAPLVKAGSDPNLPDHTGRMPLESAIDSRDLDLARTLAAVGARPLAGSWGEALWRAYDRREIDACRLLLSLGACPETPDSQGRRPLEAALADDRVDFLHLFLCYGADGRPLYYEACRTKRSYHAGIIAAHGGQPRTLPAPFLDTPLGQAIREGDARTAVRLLDRGARPDQPVAEGQSPLHLAIIMGRAGIVKELLKRGIDPNATLPAQVPESFIQAVKGGTLRWLLKNDTNVTPIMLAADSGCTDTARALLAAGARTSVWTKRNRMWPINIAARKSDVRMMRVLLGKDPIVEQRRIVVDLSDQTAIVYDSSGLELYKTAVSTGKKGHATPTGTFAITNKYRTWTSTLYDASMPCFQRFSCSDFGFHQGVVPGYPASHGCIRVPAGNAQKLFALTELGDRVEIQP
ncbi:ankyrin repeat domain-containing protein [Luteolibacter flavescens]|uniref:Ankyrin repeat domain-containing protein n=1 Tax=Luteolibacter flavescens TaxID=1859460 RepID=A0ABT3FLF3_9BACT|nr:ankyrin repeat domain-containing protein [Luteolibacter flavescens]MCW1884076.1 ankyrin repeat domain-containing protein [Luteolibacter flavescens]